MAKVTLHLSQDPDADALLSEDPLALLIGMVLDQQIPLEWAFKGPHELVQRLGHAPTATELAEMDTDKLTALFSERPALHRFPASMARRVQEMCQVLVDDFGGEAENVWTGAADGKDLLKRVKSLPGFGDQKAKIFVALLGKQLRVTAAGWEAAAGDYAKPGAYMSVADIVDQPSLLRVREYKQAKKAAAKAAAEQE